MASSLRNTARIVAEVVAGRTALTGLTHAPRSRLYPNVPQLATSNKAASVSVGGNRLKNGDAKKVEVVVGQHASLSLSTIQENTVLKDVVGTSQELDVNVSNGGLFVHVPNQLIPNASSHYKQRRRISLEPGASAVIVNICNARRVRSDSTWSPSFAFDSETTYFSSNESSALPFLTSSMFDGIQQNSLDSAFASIVAVGPRAQVVRDSLSKFSDSLESRYSSDQNPEWFSTYSAGHKSKQLLVGAINIDIREIQTAHGPVSIAKCNAELVEELITVLSECLQPLEDQLGMAPYAKLANCARTTVLQTEDSSFLDVDWREGMWQQRQAQR